MKSASWRMPRSGLAVVAALLLAAVWTPEASAQSTPAGTEADPFIVPFHWGLKPGTIQPGDKFRLMFQTENRRNGTSSTIGDYNSFVQGDAPPGGFHVDIQPYVSEFKAIVSTAAVDARDNLGATGTGVQINWVNGSKVADDYTDFWDGSWGSRAPTLGSGVGASGRAIFTGTDNDGTGYTDHQMGTSNPRFGQSRLGSPLSSGNTGNSGTRAFYAMSPVFQVDPAPPPVSVEFAKNLNQGRHQYDYNIEEGATLKPRLTFDPPTREEATLIIHATPGTATAGVDFPAGPHYVTVPAGATRHTFDIEIPWDAAIEDYETFKLTIGKLPDGFRYDPQDSAMVQIVNVSVVPSDWSLIPSGLSAGDKFRLLFKTATERDAHPSDIAEYDEFVRTRTAAHPWHADIEDYGDTFRVVGSTGAVDGNFHTGSGNIVASQQYPGHTTAYRPVYWLNGVKIADDYRFFWRGWWGDANAPANQRHADGQAATNTRGPTTGTSYCCITVSFGTEIHGSGIRTPDPYWLGGSRSTVVKGSGVASPDTGRHVSGRNSIQDEVVRDRPRGEVAPYLALSAVFEVGDFKSTDKEVWIDAGATPDHPGDSYYGCTDPDYVPGSGNADCELVLTHQTIKGARVRIHEGETAMFTVHVDSAPSTDLTIQLNVRDTQNYVAADDLDGDVVGEGIQEFVIPSGQTSVTFTVPTIYKNNDDEPGQLIASILPGTGYRVPDGSDTSRLNVGIVEIQGFWGLEGVSMDEARGTHETDLNIPFTSAAGNSYTVHYQIVDAESTATYGTGNSADYNIRSGYNRSTNRGTFTVPTGSPSGKLPVWVNDDTRLEGTEYVVLEFTSPANLKPDKITIPIHDNEPPARLKPYVHDDKDAAYDPEIDATLTEGYAPESEHQIRVAGFDYKGRRIGLEREVHYEYCVEGTATLGDDYELIKPDNTKVASAGCHPVTLPDGWDRMKLVRVKVLDDGLHDEPDETVKIRLRPSTTAGMETDASLATVPDSTRIAGETASVTITIKDTLPVLEVAYQVIVLEPDNNDTDQNPQRVRTDCQDAGNDRCRIQYRSSNPYIQFTVRTNSGLDLRTYVEAHWTVEDHGDVIVDSWESGSKWLTRSTKSYFDLPVGMRHNPGDGYAIFTLSEGDSYKYRVKDGAGKVCVAVNNGTCPQSGAPELRIPETQVANLSVAAVDDASATATWDAVPYATSYQVEYTGIAVDPDSTAHVSDLISGHTGTSWTFQHNSAESMTITVTVTPEYVDGGGVRQQVYNLASSSDLDVVIATPKQPAQCSPDLPTDAVTVSEVTGWRDGNSGADHVLRWNRVLEALGEDTGSGATPLTAEESKANESQFMASRWDRVTRTLEAIEACDDETTTTVVVPPTPEISIASGGDITEGGDATFTLTADPAPSAALDVDVSVTQSGDYGVAPGSQTVTISTGGTGTLTITTSDDSADEPDGSVSVTVDAGSGYTVGSINTATVAVADDDDPKPKVTVSAGGGVTEGTPASFTVTATPAPSAPLSVDVTVGQSGDYAASGTTGQRTVMVPTSGSATLDIATVDDGADEPDGSVSVTVDAGGGYTVGSANTATVAVADDDATPSDDDDDATPPDYSDLIDDVRGYAAEDHGQDHVDRWMRVLAAFGDDNGYEPMTAAEAQTMADTYSSSRWDPVVEALTEIEARTEPDPDPEVTVSAGGNVTEGTPASFTVTATPSPSAPLDVDVTVGQSGDYAASGTTGSRTVTVPASGSVTVDIATVDDGADEPDGSVSVTVDAGSGYTVGSARTATVNVADDDDPAPPPPPVTACVSDDQWNTVEGYYGSNSGKAPNYGENWYRVLIAYRQERTDKTLPDWQGATAKPTKPYTVTEARISEGQWTGWRPMRMALECLEAAAAKQAFVPLFPSASDPAREGLVRIVNPGGGDGAVSILATDDAGWSPDPVTLRIGAGDAVDLTSLGLELGVAARGPGGGTGPGTGDWRLDVVSDVAVRVLPYIRMADGSLAPMGEVVAAAAGERQVPTFHPADGADGAGVLRLMNRGPEPLAVSIHGIDDAGRSPGGAVSLDMPPGSSVALAASDLERGGAGLRGALGDGAGLWRLRIAAEGDLAVMSLLDGPGWRLSNLSGGAAAMPGEQAAHVVPWLPSAADATDGLGTLRVVNRSPEDGLVRIQPYDAAGRRYQPLTLTLPAGGAANLDAWDLELGNAAAGLPGGAGPGLGAWRLEVSSDLEVEVLAYVRRPTGAVEPLAAPEDRSERR